MLLQACKLVWGRRGHSLWFRVHASNIAAFDLAHCLHIILPQLPSTPPPPLGFPPPLLLSRSGDIRCQRGPSGGPPPYHHPTTYIGDYFQELDKERLKEWCCWSLYMPDPVASLRCMPCHPGTVDTVHHHIGKYILVGLFFNKIHI